MQCTMNKKKDPLAFAYFFAERNVPPVTLPEKCKSTHNFYNC